MPDDTEMLHMLCRQCGMSATIVRTDVGLVAWSDHMAIHEDEGDYETWTWVVQRLELG